MPLLHVCASLLGCRRPSVVLCTVFRQQETYLGTYRYRGRPRPAAWMWGRRTIPPTLDFFLYRTLYFSDAMYACHNSSFVLGGCGTVPPYTTGGPGSHRSRGKDACIRPFTLFLRTKAIIGPGIPFDYYTPHGHNNRRRTHCIRCAGWHSVSMYLTTSKKQKSTCAHRNVESDTLDFFQMFTCVSKFIKKMIINRCLQMFTDV